MSLSIWLSLAVVEEALTVAAVAVPGVIGARSAVNLLGVGLAPNLV